METLERRIQNIEKHSKGAEPSSLTKPFAVMTENLKNSEYFFVAHSKVQGKGLFAKKLIKKGQIILVFRGELVDIQKDPLPIDYRDEDLIQIAKTRYLAVQNPGRFVNHSCRPNAGIIEDIVLVAIKDIQVGEEMSFDYSTTMDEDYWILECKCGNVHCRKTIKDFKYLSHPIQRYYIGLGIVQRFIANQFIL